MVLAVSTTLQCAYAAVKPLSQADWLDLDVAACTLQSKQLDILFVLDVSKSVLDHDAGLPETFKFLSG